MSAAAAAMCTSRDFPHGIGRYYVEETDTMTKRGNKYF